MSKKKKIILSISLTTAAIVGITTGVVFAQDETEGDIQPGAQHEALLNRVCEIYEGNTGVAIEPEALKDAFIEAQSEMMAEAMENHLNKLVEEGVITQEEADQLIEWWEAKPDTQLPGRPAFGGRLGGPGFGGRFGSRMGGHGFPGGQGLPGDATETSSTY